MGTKLCRSCGQTKSISDFYKHRQMRDGRLNFCKDCIKDGVKKNRAARIEYYREFDRLRSMLPHRVLARKAYAQTTRGKAAHSKSVKKWVTQNQLRKAASTIFNNALRSGKIQRQPCFVCGKKAHAHHPDYDHPLDVVWLCPLHHRQAHSLADQ